MYKKFLLLFLFISICLFQGCNLPFNSSKKNIESKPSKKITIENNVNKNKEFISNFTGENVDKNSYSNTPFMAIIENSKDARPQYGLNYADIVYETSAEGGIPRFIALFQKNHCDKIGPIRSVRKYFIDIAKEYNLPFAHCGGSNEALNKIAKNKEKSINEIAYGDYFFRDKRKKAPHNLYTNSDKMEEFIKNKNLNANSKYKIRFDSDYWKNSNLGTANEVFIKLNYYYTTSYSFKNNKYIKSMDNIIAKDALTNEPICCTNIVIQITDITLQEDNLHLNIRLKGKGKGYIISNGKLKAITWIKPSENSKTLLLDENGNSVPLSPGKTWWHIVNTTSVINIK